MFSDIMQKPARSKAQEHTYFVRVSALELSFKTYANLLNSFTERLLILKTAAETFLFLRVKVLRRRFLFAQVSPL